MGLMTTNDLYHVGEKLAANYLTGKGYTVLCTNFRIKGGEIDIIALDRGTLVFAEVKTRSFHSINAALENVSHTKQVRITRTAVEYISRNQEYGNLNTRFDVLVLLYSKVTGTFKITHLQDAFLPVYDK